MLRRQRPVLTALGATGVVFAACQVYDPSLLVGASAGATAVVPSAGRAGGSGFGGLEPGTGGAVPASGLGGDQNHAGHGGFEGGAAGEDANGGAGGSVVAGGGSGGSGGKGGSAGNGTAGSGGSAGAGSGGTSASGGAGAGGVGTGGTAGVSGSAGSSGAGMGGTAGASAGMAGAPGAGGRAGSSGTSGAGAGGSAEVALTGTATADSYQNSSSGVHPPEDGNDGDLTTRWCAANGNAGHYWTLDLGATHTLTHLEVVWEYPDQAAGLPYLYVIGVSDDGTTFTTVIDRSANTATTSTQRSRFPSSTTGRYVRITVTGLPNSTTWASFWEARVFGT